jgi:hypothetical protein
MRVPNQVHLDQPWRIHEIVRDFTLEDVWMLPEITGTAAVFDRAIALATSGDPAHANNLAARFLWWVRDQLGRWFDLGEISDDVGLSGDPIPGTSESSLVGRLPDDLRGTADDVRFGHVPFVPLYETDAELAAEVSNKTVHGVMHLGWARRADGTYQGQMAVYVKPRGVFGKAYMAFIKPFRYLVVYPALEKQLARTWASQA